MQFHEQSRTQESYHSEQQSHSSRTARSHHQALLACQRDSHKNSISCRRLDNAISASCTHVLMLSGTPTIIVAKMRNLPRTGSQFNKPPKSLIRCCEEAPEHHDAVRPTQDETWLHPTHNTSLFADSTCLFAPAAPSSHATSCPVFHACCLKLSCRPRSKSKDAATSSDETSSHSH